MLNYRYWWRFQEPSMNYSQLEVNCKYSFLNYFKFKSNHAKDSVENTASFYVLRLRMRLIKFNELSSPIFASSVTYAYRWMTSSVGLDIHEQISCCACVLLCVQFFVLLESIAGICTITNSQTLNSHGVRVYILCIII